MTRAAALAIALSSPVAADEYRFGAPVITFDGAEVVFANGDTGRDHPSDFHRDLTDGLTVRVVIMQGANPAPDVIHVIPPVGYVAIPESMTVDERDTGVIVVVPEGLS